VQTHAGTAAPFNFNGLVRHYYLRAEPQMGEVQINLTPKTDRDRASHDIALDLRERLAALDVPEGTSLKVVEPPPGPPVMATCWPRSTAPTPKPAAPCRQVREAFEACPSSSMSTTASAPARACAPRSRPMIWILRRAGTGRVRHASRC
jgi:hypothetical protein